MELFRAEKVGEIAGTSEKKCRICDERLDLVRTILNVESGIPIRMFQCECGERCWED